MSTRPDLLPPAYLEALSRLQDSLEPFSFAEVEATVQEELGVRLSKAFLEFEAAPIGSASLGQVHRAVLRDGRPVVVKVQRPGIRKQVAEDLEVLAEGLCDFADRHTETGRRFRFAELLEEFRKNLARELDYQQEARHLARIGENLAAFPRILVPTPVEDYTASRVLTMDYVRGRKITSVGPLARLEIDGGALAEDSSAPTCSRSWSTASSTPTRTPATSS